MFPFHDYFVTVFKEFRGYRSCLGNDIDVSILLPTVNQVIILETRMIQGYLHTPPHNPTTTPPALFWGAHGRCGIKCPGQISIYMNFSHYRYRDKQNLTITPKIWP